MVVLVMLTNYEINRDRLSGDPRNNREEIFQRHCGKREGAGMECR